MQPIGISMTPQAIKVNFLTLTPVSVRLLPNQLNAQARDVAHVPTDYHSCELHHCDEFVNSTPAGEGSLLRKRGTRDIRRLTI